MIKPHNVDRASKNYLSLLEDRLGFDSLVSKALKIENNASYDKIIRVDFCGISGSTLLGPEGEAQDRIHSRFLEIFDKLDLLEEKRIKLQIRFIFLYIYSDFAFAQIEAEKTKFRATLNDVKYDSRHFDLYYLTLAHIENSSIYHHQTIALDKIQEIHNKYFANKKRSPILNIRFTCLPLNFCLLTINNEAFIDPYSYAKERLNVNALSYKTPLSYITAGSKHFSIIEDHFRYIWNHPTSIVFEDATEANMQKVNSGPLNSLSKIKRPENINFETKAKILKSKLNASDDIVKRWQIRVEQKFNNMTRSVKTIYDEEILFIGFSWKNGKPYADKLKTFIEEDFKGTLKVNIVNLEEAKDPLYTELIRNMHESTIGLIIFTKDHQTKDDKGVVEQHSRPNLYFEFGYLKRHLEKLESNSKRSRTLILSENNFSVASDLHDLGRFTLTKKIELDYYPLLRRFIRLHRTLTKNVAVHAVNNYVKRLHDAYHKGLIDNKDFKGKSFNNYIDEITNNLNDLVAEKLIVNDSFFLPIN